jgi:8-oxo-dGTP pyrophosphatase MutT (NUDIX family)
MTWTRLVHDPEMTYSREGRRSMEQVFRTVLEQKIRERRQTFEEFAAYAETYAREHKEPGTLGVRHLQRLVSGRRSDGRPLGPVRPETARLLERIFCMNIDELLAPPQWSAATSRSVQALRVAVAVVVKEDDVLIVCRRGDDANGISWQFPAGIVKPNGQAAVVAVRETFAETGVHCIALDEMGSRVHPVTGVVCDYVLCEYLAGDARNVDVVENVNVTWVDRSELLRFIPAQQIYRPILNRLEFGPQAVSV